MKQILLMLILSAVSIQAQTSADPARAEKPKAKLLVSWQSKNCRACQTKTIDGQSFQIISDELLTVAFHGGSGSDFLVGDVYIFNKSRRAISFDPEKDIVVSAWRNDRKKADGAENLRPFSTAEAVGKTARPEFWSGVLRAFGSRRAAETTEENQPVLLKTETLMPNKAHYGSIYFPKSINGDAIGFIVSVGDRMYSFSFSNPKDNSPGAK